MHSAPGYGDGDGDGDGRQHPLFFTRPFGTMFGPTGGLFGPCGFLALHRFHDFHRQISVRSGPLIEELSDDGNSLEINFRQSQQAIVEYPDDKIGSGITHQVGRQSRNGHSSHSPSISVYRANNGYHSFSYGSSSVTSGGTGEFHGCSSSLGRDGVLTEEHVEKDTFVEKAALGLCYKVHAITKKQNLNGPDSIVSTLYNLTPEEAEQCEVDLEAGTKRSLRCWNISHLQTSEDSMSMIYFGLRAIPSFSLDWATQEGPCNMQRLRSCDMQICRDIVLCMERRGGERD